MKSVIKNFYDKISMVPVTILIFLGVYEMLFGQLLRGVLSGKFKWMVPITQNMFIDTIIIVIVVFFMVNGFPKAYKNLSNNNKTKTLATIILVICVSIAIGLFIYGAFYMNQVLFTINYWGFMGILAIICIIQKVLDNRIYPEKNKIDTRDHSIRELDHEDLVSEELTK